MRRTQKVLPPDKQLVITVQALHAQSAISANLIGEHTCSLEVVLLGVAESDNDHDFVGGESERPHTLRQRVRHHLTKFTTAARDDPASLASALW